MDEKIPSWPLKISQSLSIGIILAACWVLAGWAFDMEFIKRVIPGAVAMNPVTAVNFILLSLGFCFLLRSKPNLARLLILAGFLTGLLRLLEYAGGWPIGIDRLLFSSKLGETGRDLPNRMAPNTALNFILISFSYFFISSKKRFLSGLSQSALIFTGLTAFLAFIGHTYNARGLYQPLPFIGMAVHTAACFMALTLALAFAYPERGFASLMASTGLGGLMARRMLPVSFVFPVVIGWLRLRGERTGLYGMEFGLGLMVFTMVILLILLILLTATSMNESDLKRQVSERRLAHALDLAEAAVVSVDAQQRIISFDERAENQFGYSSREVLGQLLEILIPSQFAQVHRKHVNDFSDSGEIARREVMGRRKDGSQFYAEVAISRSGEGPKTIFTAVVRDVTEKIRAAEERVRGERLEAANKELESFSYSVSHDLRAPLRHIDGFIEMLKERSTSSLDEQSRHYMDTISNAAKRMGNLIDDLLSFSRMSRAEMAKVKVHLLSLLEEVRNDFKEDEMRRKIDWRIAELPAVEGDSAMLRLVFTNLIGNALKFTRTRDKTVIEVGTTTSERPGQIVIFVKDNGVGFDPRYKDKLFGVFQRLHRLEEFEGTGIGLANVRRIIQRHGGDVWAEGKPEEGAAFYFSLPVHK